MSDLICLRQLVRSTADAKFEIIIFHKYFFPAHVLNHILNVKPCYGLVSSLQKILISTTGGSGAYSEVRLRRRILNDFWVGHSERLPPPSTFLERNHLFSFLSLAFFANLQGGIFGRGAFKCTQVSSPAPPLTTPLSGIVALVSGLQFLSYPLLRITRLYNYSGSIIPSCSCV